MREDFFKPEYLLALPIYLLIILGALFLHEMGHYLAAKAFKMPIKDVVIGRGKLIKSWVNKRGIEWWLHLWPIGAHVHIRDIESRPFYQKAITILAGPAINIAIVPILFFALYVSIGQPSIPNVIVGVEQGLVADEAGLEPGDRITAVNGTRLKNFDEMWRTAYELGATENLYTIQRGNQTFDRKIKPSWTKYQDTKGVPRENARFGIVWTHAPYALNSILAINGQDTKDKEDRVRELLIQNFDKETIITLEGPEDELKPIRILLDGDLNQALLDEEADEYDLVYFGLTKGNLYMKSTIAENAHKAFQYSATLVWSITKLPFQIFPIDKSIIKNRASVTNKDTKIANKIFALIHLFAVTSIVIGLLNLLPLPNLDGGQLIDQLLKLFYGDAITNKFRANVFAATFLLLYASIFIANMDNFYGYIDSRAKKVHEFIDQKILNRDGEQNNG